jgi:hypothetical protein
MPLDYANKHIIGRGYVDGYSPTLQSYHAKPACANSLIFKVYDALGIKITLFCNKNNFL